MFQNARIICSVWLVVMLTACNGWTYKQMTESMMPTIKPNDVVVCNKWEYLGNEPKRNDIVIYRRPVETEFGGKEGDVYCGRIVAVGNDSIEIRDRRVYINDNLSTVDYKGLEDSDALDDFERYVVPPKKFFIMGDNLVNSFDSRFWRNKVIGSGAILGKVVSVKDAKTGKIRDLE